MSIKRSALVAAAGGSIWGALAGIVAGSVVGILGGIAFGDVSLALDGAILGALVLAIGGAAYGARVGRDDKLDATPIVKRTSPTSLPPSVRPHRQVKP